MFSLLPLPEVEVVKQAVILTETGEPFVDHIPNELFRLFPNLSYLRINSQISEIKSPDFNSSTKLTHLYLTRNKISKLIAGTFQTLNLTVLDLSNNEIETIDDFTFSGQSYLHNLSLPRNKLTVIKRNTFDGLIALDALVLESNEIVSIEDGAFSTLVKLGKLYLFGNKLKSLNDNMFTGLTALKLLSLKRNEIDRIGNSMYNWSSIEKISLAENPVGDVDLMKFAQLPKLKELDLEKTGFDLKSFDIGSGATVESSLEGIDLQHNNLTDTNDLKKLRIFPKLTKVKLKGNLYNNFSININSVRDFIRS